MIVRMAKKSAKRGVTNEKIIKVLLDIDKKLDTLDARVEIQGRRSNRFENTMSGVESKLKRFETQIGKHLSVFEERMNEIEGSLKTIVEWGAMKADLRDFATKDDLERIKAEIIEPIIKAVDKDAEAIFSYGKRIAVLERRVGVPSK